MPLGFVFVFPDAMLLSLHTITIQPMQVQPSQVHGLMEAAWAPEEVHDARARLGTKKGATVIIIYHTGTPGKIPTEASARLCPPVRNQAARELMQSDGNLL